MRTRSPEIHAKRVISAPVPRSGTDAYLEHARHSEFAGWLALWQVHPTRSLHCCGRSPLECHNRVEHPTDMASHRSADTLCAGPSSIIALVNLSGHDGVVPVPFCEAHYAWADDHGWLYYGGRIGELGEDGAWCYAERTTR